MAMLGALVTLDLLHQCVESDMSVGLDLLVGLLF